MSKLAGDALSSAPAAAPQKPTLTILVIDRSAQNPPKVAGLTLNERWAKALGDAEVELEKVTRLVSPDGLKEALLAQHEPFLLADGGALLDPIGIENAIESSLPVKSGELVVFSGKYGRAPLAALSLEAARAMAALPALGELDWPSLLVALGSAHAVQTRSVTFPEAYFYTTPTSEGEARDAEWGLLQRLQWRPGGLVAKYLNRPLSIRVSRHLVNTGVTPNQTTMVAFVIGALGVACIALGGYGYAVLGALLLQLNSVVDGIDGELARVRHQKSEFGAFLDSICDELLNGAMYAAIGWHLSLGGYPLLLGEGLIPLEWFFPLGVFAGSVSFTYSLIHWHCKLKHKLGFYWWWEAYKPRKQVQRSTSFYTYFKKLFWKESTLFILVVFSLARLLNVYVVLGAIAALPVAVLLVVHILILRERW